MCVCMCVREREAKKYLAFLLVFTCVYVCDACVSLREKERETEKVNIREVQQCVCVSELVSMCLRRRERRRRKGA